MILLSFALALSAPAQAAETFGDWKVRCDAQACAMESAPRIEQAAADMSQDSAYEEGFRLARDRRSGAYRLDVEIISVEVEGAGARLTKALVDGRLVTPGSFAANRFSVDGASAARLAKAMAAGSQLQLADDRGAIWYIASLKGAAAALRRLEAPAAR